MNLQDAMFNKLYEASINASRKQSQQPQGLQPMNTQQGQEVLKHLHRIPHTPPPKLSIKPFTASQGQAILDRLNER